jgi:hypothetical protein
MIAADVRAVTEPVTDLGQKRRFGRTLAASAMHPKTPTKLLCSKRGAGQ